ncbi:hypothetical protein D3C76_1619940 [compost metagenome]
MRRRGHPGVHRRSEAERPADSQAFGAGQRPLFEFHERIARRQGADGAEAFVH